MRDAALAGYVSRAAMGYSGTGGDPQTAANLAASIADPAIQEHALEGVIKLWLNENSTAATQWIEGSRLPDAQKQRLLALPPGG